MHITTLLIYGILNIALMLINHFPLFAMLLQLKDTLRLPGMLCNLLLDTSANTSQVEFYITLIPQYPTVTYKCVHC